MGGFRGFRAGAGERSADLSDYADYAGGREEELTEKKMIKRGAFWRFIGEIWKKSAILEGGFWQNCVDFIVVFRENV